MYLLVNSCENHNGYLPATNLLLFISLIFWWDLIMCSFGVSWIKHEVPTNWLLIFLRHLIFSRNPPKHVHFMMLNVFSWGFEKLLSEDSAVLYTIIIRFLVLLTAAFNSDVDFFPFLNTLLSKSLFFFSLHVVNDRTRIAGI